MGVKAPQATGASGSRYRSTHASCHALSPQAPIPNNHPTTRDWRQTKQVIISLRGISTIFDADVLFANSNPACNMEPTEWSGTGHFLSATVGIGAGPVNTLVALFDVAEYPDSLGTRREAREDIWRGADDNAYSHPKTGQKILVAGNHKPEPWKAIGLNRSRPVSPTSTLCHAPAARKW
ncbi:predicted protein [Histoplasma capsulatum var. duboisii H88]|uniref:Predicted protein n=2 Tax=Ajellomyces capsulatus TaxID=5037 RepID=F0UGH4_AJEC8|nr:predicted protein [Histoplasma capsulatum H143]EGC45116.1 predicted protein [Histoplasma capsulatum var. duboisii H88]